MSERRDERPRREPRPAGTSAGAATLGDAGRMVAWGLALWGGAQLVGAALARNATAAVAVQAVLAEWGAGQMGIAWTAPNAAASRDSALVRRIAVGAGLGAATAGLAAVAALAVHAASMAPWSPAPGALAIGAIVAALGAVRDELLVRGVVLRVTRGLLPARAALVACGAATAAARWGQDGQLTTALASEALRGVALGALWIRDRGAWMPWAANAAWTWTAATVVGGGILDVRFLVDPLRAPPTIAVLAVASLAASVWSTRTLPAPAKER